MQFFISYVYEDGAYKAQLASWARSGELGGWEPVYETDDVRQDGKKAIQRHLNPMIASCGAVIVLVGNNSHNHEWLDYEVHNARSAGKGIISVRLPNTAGGPPVGVSCPSIGFNPKDIRAALSGIR